MKRNEEITLQSLAEKGEVRIGYSDNEIVVVDSIQQFTEINAAHIAMNVIMICTNGKIQARMNDMQMSLSKNQVAIVPQNVLVTDIMISPDFDMKAMFLTTSILQSLLREKMMIWNDMMYVHHNHVITLDDEDVDNYSQFYDMLRSAVERGNKKPFRKEVVQSLLKVALLALCGEMKLMLPEDNLSEETKLSNSHFQRFLEVLHNTEVKYHTVEYYASELCISPKHLTSICKRISGKTANEWIREQVIEDIRYYLKKTDLSIKQVGNRVGFSNTSFFGKYVKQHLGMTPMEYRNS